MNTKQQRNTIFLILLILGVLIISMKVGYSDERKACNFCGMYLDMYKSTRHVVVFEDGTQKETCSIACVAKIYKSTFKKIKDILSADFITQKLFNSKDAFYLEGSDIPGVMSYISRIAFQSKDDAMKYQAKHGGAIITFKDALEHQINE